MKVRILPAAQRDLLDGYAFYETLQAGIGARFLDALSGAIDSLAIHAGVHEVHFGRYHRLPARRFPFAVYYRVEDDAAVVYAVLDCRRDPAWTRRHLVGEGP